MCSYSPRVCGACALSCQPPASLHQKWCSSYEPDIYELEDDFNELTQTGLSENTEEKPEEQTEEKPEEQTEERGTKRTREEPKTLEPKTLVYPWELVICELCEEHCCHTCHLRSKKI